MVKKKKIDQDMEYARRNIKKLIQERYIAEKDPKIEILERHESIVTDFTFPLRRKYQEKFITFVLRDNNTGDVFSRRMFLPMPCKSKIFKLLGKED